MSEVVTPVARITGRTGLRSATSLQYNVPRTRMEFGKRAFEVAAPKLWNDLPFVLRQYRELSTFKRHLKTHFFNQAYNV